MKRSLLPILSLFSSLISSHADEGMWTFDQLPLTQIKMRYQVDLTEQWIEHVQQSSLRISLGGSASFVSPNGLVMTNHHVGSKAIYNLSQEDCNLIEEGFYAKSHAEELKCPNVYIDQLIAIHDITGKVNAALTPSMSYADKEVKRKELLAQLKEKAQTKTGLQVQVVTLYQGGKYQLYFYKRFTDVRLVMAPEKAIAYFGGDIENFEFPRYDMDFCFFRVYENEKPLSTSNYFKWSPCGPTAGEPLFVIGNPGSTRRIFTVAHKKFMRDESLPLALHFIDKRLQSLNQYAAIDEEHQRQAEQMIFSLKNAQKVLTAESKGLNETPILQKKEAEENELLSSLNSEEKQPWEQINAALIQVKPLYPQYFYLEGINMRLSQAYSQARTLVRLSEEYGKPNDQRLPEYQETERPTIERSILSTEPYYPDLEAMLLAESLNDLQQQLGDNDPTIRSILGNETPEQKAKEIIDHSQIGSIEFRKQLLENPSLVATSSDPMIVLARTLDPHARAVRLSYENQFDSIKQESYAQITQILYERYGDRLYPDATFTLRLSYGQMKGYDEKGCWIQPTTHLKGLFAESALHCNMPPYRLPDRWSNLEKKLNRSAFVNFVSTNDIIGGNSGSPIINQKAEIVGLIFDGNKDSLLWDLEYSDETGRAVSVHSLGILYALEHVYHAKSLVKEIDAARSKQ
ncbi:MAG: S46 family peptidase [Simkaniaceae bacterium]|nr:S46 family peptidase [Simkaniaceae bacterium]MCF7851985.1 S46 family peptidase [Simkaniaceae bacterium]